MNFLQYQQPNVIDLNKATIHNDNGPHVPLADHEHRKHCVQSGNTFVVFAHHTRLLCDEIRRWPVVVGCVAWLTNREVLDALRHREVSIIVQKEDWMRPDSDWTKLRQRLQYDQLKGIRDKHVFGTGYNQCGAPDIDPVLCCGIVDAQAKYAGRMHHKFLVFGEYRTWEEPNPVPYDPTRPGDDQFWEESCTCTEFMPQAVWTGSFNMTRNATLSLENALLIRDPVVAKAYQMEWQAVLGISEALDWNAEYIAPDFRIGT